jgi:chromosome segregation ATPase
MRRFSRRLFGADSGEVKQFLDETASNINRLQSELDKMKSQLAAAAAERNALQTKLKDATAETEKLRAQVTVAEDVIDAYQAQDDQNTQTGADHAVIQKRAQEVTAEAEELRTQLKAATAEVEKLRAQVTAAQVKIAAYPAQKNLMTQVAAERDALQTRLKEVTAEAERLRAQVTAQEKTGAAPAQKGMIAQLVAERDALQARLKEVTGELETTRSHAAKAQEKAATSHVQESLISRTLLSAQKVADDLIQTARTQAEEIIGQANKHTQDSRQAAVRTQQAMEQYVATLITKIETFVSDRHALAQNLDTLIESHADSLKSLKRLQGEMQDKILPALDQLSREIKNEGEKVRRTLAGPSPLPRETVSPPSVELEPDLSHRPEEPEQRPPHAAGHDRVGPPALRGEIIVSPVRNHYQAAKLTAGVSRMEGMRFARLRSLQGDTAVIEVVTEAGALATTDFSIIAGVPMEVIEATDARLVLRVAGPTVHPIPG